MTMMLLFQLIYKKKQIAKKNCSIGKLDMRNLLLNNFWYTISVNLC